MTVNLNDQESGGCFKTLFQVETWGLLRYLKLRVKFADTKFSQECSLVRVRTLGSWVRQDIKLPLMI